MNDQAQPRRKKRVRIIVDMLDGTRVECVSTSFMATADRVAFERTFQVSSGELAAFKGAFDPDTGKVLDEAKAKGVKNEWMAFFAWRIVNRERGDQGSFDAFVDRVEEISIEDVKLEGVGDGDPTDAAQPTG
ncbi:MAG: hypothetical protein ACRDH8_12985 [Actinomycetota bacterium]